MIFLLHYRCPIVALERNHSFCPGTMLEPFSILLKLTPIRMGGNPERRPHLHHSAGDETRPPLPRQRLLRLSAILGSNRAGIISGRR